MMVAISIIGIVIGLLYAYYNSGWRLFNKSFQLGKLQANSRAALEQMSYNLKQTSKELIYTNTNYNINVPLPDDFFYGKPYIYFALAQQKDYGKLDLKTNGTKAIATPKYDYYLYYVAQIKNRDGEIAADKARLRLFLVKDQDGDYTRNNAKDWPVLPPDLQGETNYNESDKSYKTGFISPIQFQDLSAEFSTYNSEFNYNFYNVDYRNLFTIDVAMVDSNSQTKVEFKTAVSPRN